MSKLITARKGYHKNLFYFAGPMSRPMNQSMANVTLNPMVNDNLSLTGIVKNAQTPKQWGYNSTPYSSNLLTGASSNALGLGTLGGVFNKSPKEFFSLPNYNPADQKSGEKSTLFLDQQPTISNTQPLLTPLQQIAADKSTPQMTINPNTTGLGFNSPSYSNTPVTSDGITDVTPNGDTGGNTGGSTGGETEDKGGFTKSATMKGIGIAANTLGNIPTGDRRGMWDTADPTHYLAGNKKSAVGTAMGDAGVGLFQAGASSGQPYLMLAGAGLKIGGSVTDALWGSDLKDENIAKVESGIQGAYDTSNAQSVDEYLRDWKNKQHIITNFDQAYIGEDGVFSHKAKDKYNDLKEQALAADAMQTSNFRNAAYNLNRGDTMRQLYNMGAYGGKFDNLIGVDPSTPIGYALHTDAMALQGNGLNNISNTLYAFGGNTQANGGTFSDGTTHINAGGTHESNPNEGVQLGVDPEGTPNLVEEGEVIYNDYVFSNRLTVPEFKKDDDSYEAKMLRKYSVKTFAEAAKRIEKKAGADERPTDEIAIRGMESDLEVLAQVQEKEREKQKLEEMKQAIDNMSPEELAALQQQIAMQQQAMQQQDAQQIPQEAVQEAVQGAPQEQMVDPQQVAQMQAAQQMQSQVPVAALGGQLPLTEEDSNVYAIGGPLKRVLKYHGKTDKDWEALSDKEKRGLINKFRDTLKRKEKLYFDNSLANYNRVQEFQKAQRESALTYDDVKGFNKEQLDRIAYAMDNGYKSKDFSKLSENEANEALEKLKNRVVQMSQNQDKSVDQINQQLQDWPHKKWIPVDADKAWKDTNTYNWSKFYDDQNKYEISRGLGNQDNTYAADKNYELPQGFKTIQEYQESQPYTDYTKAVIDAIDRSKDYTFIKGDDGTLSLNGANTLDDAQKADLQLINALYKTANNTALGNKGIFVDNDGNISLDKDAATNFRHRREDNVGGAFHINPEYNKTRELYQMADNPKRYLNPKGDWQNYYTDKVTDLEDGTTLHTLTPKDTIAIARGTEDYLPEGMGIDTNGNYYYTNGTGNGAAGNNGVGGAGSDTFSKAPNWPYFLSMGLQGAGLLYNLATPIDYSNPNALITATNNIARDVKGNAVRFKPVGEYLKYNPFDINYVANQLRSTERATAKDIINNATNGNIGALQAGLVNNAYANQIALGNAYRQGFEYDDKQRAQSAEFNRGTDEFNSEGMLKAALANQDARSRVAGFQLQGLEKAYAQRQALEDAKSASINAGLTGLANSIYNYAYNKYNQDLLGWGLEHNQYPIKGYSTASKGYSTSSKGGKLKRRKKGGLL